MTRRNKIGIALVGLAVLLFVIPAVIPVQPLLTHETRYSVPAGPERLEEEGFEVISYENLSERGKELYVRTLENGGDYQVRDGRGAPDFEYPTDAERFRALENDSRSIPGRFVIERPEDDSGLPASDERLVGGERDGLNESEYRERATRYDAMRTRKDQPPLGSLPQLARLFASLLAVLSMGTGGYLVSSK